jgi:hypothetical protein
MKIVLFKNGTYGIRKRCFPFFWEFRYLNAAATGDYKDYWWGGIHKYVFDYATFKTLHEAEERMQEYKTRQKPEPEMIDYGTPIL